MVLAVDAVFGSILATFVTTVGLIFVALINTRHTVGRAERKAEDVVGVALKARDDIIEMQGKQIQRLDTRLTSQDKTLEAQADSLERQGAELHQCEQDKEILWTKMHEMERKLGSS